MEFQNKIVVITGAARGIASLTHAMTVSLAGKVRVNSISPGWIHFGGSCCDVETHVKHDWFV